MTTDDHARFMQLSEDVAQWLKFINLQVGVAKWWSLDVATRVRRVDRNRTGRIGTIGTGEFIVFANMENGFDEPEIDDDPIAPLPPLEEFEELSGYLTAALGHWQEFFNAVHNAEPLIIAADGNSAAVCELQRAADPLVVAADEKQVDGEVQRGCKDAIIGATAHRVASYALGEIVSSIRERDLHSTWQRANVLAECPEFVNAALERLEARMVRERWIFAKHTKMPPPAEVRYVSTYDVAPLVGLEDGSMGTHRKAWGNPDVPGKGRGGRNLWLLSKLLPILKTQWPEVDFTSLGRS